jgi:hypothetical protein
MKRIAKTFTTFQMICTIFLILFLPFWAAAVEPVVGDAARGAAKGAVIGAIAGDAGKGAAAGAIGSALIGGMRRN